MKVDCQSPASALRSTASQIRAIAERGVERGDFVPEVDAAMGTVVSPIAYRSLFGAVPITATHAQALVSACLKLQGVSALLRPDGRGTASPSSADHLFVDLVPVDSPRSDAF